MTAIHGIQTALSRRVKRFNLRLNGGSVTLPEEDVAVLFHSGAITRQTPCAEAGKAGWSTVDEFFPLLKYGAAKTLTAVQREVPSKPYRHEPRVTQRPAQTSAMTAGWVCFGIGLAVCWIFPPGYVFFSVAMIMAIVALATHQVADGLILLLSSFLGAGVSMLVSFLLAVGLFAAAAGQAISKVEDQAQRQNFALAQQMNQAAAASQRLIQTFPATSAPGAGLVIDPQRSAAEAFQRNIATSNQIIQRRAVPKAAAPAATPRYDVSTEALSRHYAELEQKRKSYQARADSIRRSIDWWQKMGRDSHGSGREIAEKNVDDLQKQLQKLNSENVGM